MNLCEKYTQDFVWTVCFYQNRAQKELIRREWTGEFPFLGWLDSKYTWMIISTEYGSEET